MTNQTTSAIIKQFTKNGYMLLTELETDRRNKMVPFTELGIAYARKIIPQQPRRTLMP